MDKNNRWLIMNTFLYIPVSTYLWKVRYISFCILLYSYNFKRIIFVSFILFQICVGKLYPNPIYLHASYFLSFLHLLTRRQQHKGWTVCRTFWTVHQMKRLHSWHYHSNLNLEGRWVIGVSWHWFPTSEWTHAWKGFGLRRGCL